MLSRRRPAWPTKGSPRSSSSAPGPSPTKSQGPVVLPTPNTACLRCSHRPQRLQSRTASRRASQSIDATPADRYLGIGLLYGLCGRAAVGLVARELPLVIPRVHDCIALFLDGPERYREQFKACPGTVYLTPGWCEKEAHPDRHRIEAARTDWSATLHPSFAGWADKYGESNALFIHQFMQSWRENYQRVAFINNGLGEVERYRRQATELAAAAGWRYEELPAGLDYVTDLVAGGEDARRFLIVPPGHRVVATNDARLLAAVADRPGAAASGADTGRFVFGDRAGGAGRGLGLGVDAGGTFTDAVLVDLASGQVVAKAKVPTTPGDLAGAVEAAVRGLDPSRFAELELVAISTTLATNAIVEGRGARVGLLLMPWNAKSLNQIASRPARVVPGRLNIDGEEVDPVDPEAVRAAAEAMLAEGVEAFAISGYAGTHNPVHEQAVREALKRVTDRPVVCGHELSSRLDFIRRANTAVLNARLLPVIGGLMDAVERSLERQGIAAPVYVVRGDGSLIELAAARRRPIETLLSGPAASAVGARFLTGAEELLAVDIGGTTTDIAVVEGGRVAVCADGPTVGEWRTAVAAVDVLTCGLGGDSHVKLIEGGLDVTIGPERATPLAVLAQRHPEVAEALAELAARTAAGYVSPAEIEFFELVDPRNGLVLTDRERAVVDLLYRGPASRRRIAAATGAAAIQTIPTDRLEQLGVLRRAAITPTDVLHVTGRFTAFDTAAARDGLTVLARVASRAVEDYAAWVHDQVVRRVAHQMIRRELTLRVGDPDHDGGTVLPRLLSAALDPASTARLQLRFDERRPVVGIGAPAAAFLPAAGALLNAEVIVPEHAEVANAIGAVTGKVTLRATVSIQPDAGGGFLMLSPIGRGEFADLREAQEAATERIVAHLRQAAGRFGTDEQAVTVDVVQRTGRLLDGSDQLIEVRVEGLLEGRPRTALAAGD